MQLVSVTDWLILKFTKVNGNILFDLKVIWVRYLDSQYQYKVFGGGGGCLFVFPFFFSFIFILSGEPKQTVFIIKSLDEVKTLV